jgi:hypothetical protein
MPGHGLPEIRLRAAETLRFKLANQLLTLSDLVHEQPFLRSLLTWLNGGDGASAPLTLFVLDTLADIAQVPS